MSSEIDKNLNGDNSSRRLINSKMYSHGRCLMRYTKNITSLFGKTILKKKKPKFY